MQSVGPYRFTHMLGICPVGKAWAAIDGQGRFVTVAVLDAAAANTPGWRESFAGIANSMSQMPDGLAFMYADFSAPEPWVAYSAEVGPGAEKLFQALGQEYQPVPTADDGQPSPVSGVPQQVSGPPVSGAPQQVSGSPVSGAPQPTSGAPWTLHTAALPTVPPIEGWAHPPVAQSGPAVPPVPTTPNPLDTSGEPRIAPVARPPRSRTGLWIGAVVLAAVLAGGAGLLSGGALGGGDTPDPSTSASPPLYEATQYSLNKAKFDADLAPIAEPWLPEVGGCAVDTEVGGPELPDGEKRHVFCRYLSLSVHFAVYESAEKKTAARTHRQQMGVVNRALAPGLREASKTTGGASGAPGSYVEYAGNGHDGRPVCGIWWDRDDSMTAVYFETPCAAGIAGNWDALRDVWKRTS
ncbi:hypothetical protein E1211_12945 [Micromonospora sp. 15K316]|uniref:hypothetical protein n=1 Tax=Micromonospora sp. 15K316 TaxID=2530376 RepID=UPI00104E1EB7|nr:hypothetical protein [Micromonospora sp. 15K316]TDC36601.1 hypothetical protein E1211_12945 [Micromonospora sp. 15K316]